LTTSTTRAAAGPDFEALEQRLGYRFSDAALLRRSMAHRSWCAETPGELSNERLEFLGDAVLGWAVADLVYRRYLDLPEGKLTDLRKSVVNAGALAAVARTLELGDWLLLGKGESAAGGRGKTSILSDALEAVLGAIYLDGGAPAAFDFVARMLDDQLADTAARLDELDHKTQLQELAARTAEAAPVYVVSSEGPDHAKHFSATVYVGGQPVGSGTGRSKKSAEQAAASEAVGALAAATTES
jgi:ribonuclease-3